MIHNRDTFRVLSRPLGIEWAGWRSTTTELQACGWDLAAEFDYHSNAYRLLMKHEACDLYAITRSQILPWELDEIPAHCPVFQVVRVARTMYINMIDDLSHFVQIDARPQISTRQMRAVEDFNIFALARSKAEEILVNRADMSVIEHLEAIKSLQDPKQHEIRQRMLRAEPDRPARATPKLHLVASVIHCEELAA